MESSKISVIVPIYNSEQYINECVKSVLKQTFVELELILIDDGSSDKSIQICESACTKDKRIILLCQEHKGVSAARNLGLSVAKGKYIFFLDSDDVIHPQLLEGLYRLQERNHSVIATTGFYFAGEGGFQSPKDWKMEINILHKNFYLCNDIALKPLYLTNSRTWLCAIGGKMILREAISNLQFDEKLSHSEDMWFVFQLLAYGADVSILFRNWYYYRRGEKCSSKIFSVNTCRSRYRAESYIRDYYVESGRKSDAIYMEKMILDDITQWRKNGRKKGDIQLLNLMKNILKIEKRNGYFLDLKGYNKAFFYFGYMFFHLRRMIKETIQCFVRLLSWIKLV